VFYAGLGALSRPLPAHTVRALYFGENWEDPRDFRPTLYVDTSAGHEQWLRAIQAYELFRGGLSSFPYRRYYEALATIRGAEAGCDYAKAFTTLPEALRTRISGFDAAIPYPLTTASSIIVHAHP
jgi:hypothetical protein